MQTVRTQEGRRINWLLVGGYTVFRDAKGEITVHLTIYAKPHRTAGCFDDRLLTKMKDTGLYVP